MIPSSKSFVPFCERADAPRAGYGPHAAARSVTPGAVTGCRVHHLGLSLREVLVIDSMFCAYPELQQHFVYGDSTPEDRAHILLVNADDRTALNEWEQWHAACPQVQGIMVTATPSRFPGRQTLAGPLSFRDCAMIISALVRADNDYARQVDDASIKTHTATPIRILVVDDSLAAREFMRIKLAGIATENLQVMVEFAASGEDAVAAERRNHYDLIFLGVTMDGFATCRQLRALGQARVVMVANSRTAADFQRGRAVGCDHYLTMPPPDTDLHTVLLLTALKKMRCLDIRRVSVIDQVVNAVTKHENSRHWLFTNEVAVSAPS